MNMRKFGLISLLGALSIVPAAQAQQDSSLLTLDRIFKLIQSPFEKHDGDEAFHQHCAAPD